MKRLLLFLTCLSVYGYSQPKLGMCTSYTLNPASALSPTVGVPYNSTFTLSTWVKNKGNATFNGTLAVITAVDTTSFISPTSQLDSSSYGNMALGPNDSISITHTVNVTPSFRSNGNGNTIVVWPVSQGIQTTDSFRVIIYVVSTTGIPELQKAVLQVYPNPAGSQLHIKAEKDVALKNVVVYDIYMRKVMECSFAEMIDLSALKPGTYWVRASSADKTYSALIIKRE